VWKSRKVEIGLFLLAYRPGTVCALRDKLVGAQRQRHALERLPKYLLWISSIGFVRFPAGRAFHHPGADLVPLHPV
jgi:hypothetical protein